MRFAAKARHGVPNCVRQPSGPAVMQRRFLFGRQPSQTEILPAVGIVLAQLTTALAWPAQTCPYVRRK